MKGRTVPPPTRRLTIAELADFIVTHPAAWVLQYAHDDGCAAQYTQRNEDCRCNPDITLRTADGTRAIALESGAA